MFRPNFIIPVLALSCISALPVNTPALAQSVSKNTQTVAKPGRETRSVLDLLRYDPKQQGPLIFVDSYPRLLQYDFKDEQKVRQNIGGKTPAQFAEQRDLRVLPVGDITALVPRTMKEIVTNPGKPDPYAGMPFSQRFVLVLSTLTREQWKQAGSANGIGLRELNNEQRALFTGIWQNKSVTIQTVRKRGYNDSKATGSVPVSAIRFRLSRKVGINFKSVVVGEGGFGHLAGYDLENSEKEPQQELLLPNNDEDTSGNETVVAYGVPILKTVPNRLKTGHLPLGAPALNVGIRLDGSHKTVGELLDAISETTRLRLVADKRLATLPVGYRLVPGGQTVSTGDILQALCRSVTGTFRRLAGPGGETLYLLTDDVEGIGTRFARLERWAEAVNQQRSQIYQKAVDNCAENDPLTAVGFAPGDEYALPANQLKKVDDAYRSQQAWSDSTLIPVSELSPALRKEFQRMLKLPRVIESAEVIVRTDKVGLDTNFHCDWILPGDRVLPARFNSGIGSAFFSQVAVPKSQRAALRVPRAYKNPNPSGFPAALKRRVLSVGLPVMETETRTLLALLTKKGFTEVWFRVEDSSPATRERLQSAVALGGEQKIRVGVVIPWLSKEAGSGSKPDINILGETGAEWVKASEKLSTDNQQPGRHLAYFADRNAGWVVPETQDIPKIVERVASFVQIADLSEVTFTNLVPPGYSGSREQGYDGLFTGEGMGYNAGMRYRCVQEQGFDPVDVATNPRYLYVSVNLPVFYSSWYSYEVAKPLAELRSTASKAHLTKLYAAIRGRFPQNRFYLAAQGIGQNDSYGLYSFYGYWVKPLGFSESTKQWIMEPKQLRAVAFHASPTPVFAIRGLPMEHTDTGFWDAWHNSVEEAGQGWGGLSLNMGTESLGDVTALLNQLPDEPELAKSK